MADFATNRSLLNPKFEGYKLSLLEQDEHVSNYPLRFRPSQANVSGRTKTPLSFEEVQSRITHNHLAISSDDKSALYIDGDYNVIGVELGSDLKPKFTILCELPRPIGSSESHLEYPSAVSIPGFWLVSDGTGLVFVLKKNGNGYEIIAQYNLLNESNNASEPLRIHTAYVTDATSTTAICLVSSHSSSIAKSKETTQGDFSLRVIEVPLDRTNSNPEALKVIWHGKGKDSPIYAKYDSGRNSFCVLAGSVFTSTSSTLPLPPQAYEPSTDELAPIPRKEENLDVISKPPPYSWTQTSDSVTIAFALPSNVTKDAIHVKLTAKTLSLLIKHELPSTIPLPRYSIKQLWDSINISSSFWTWDRVADKHFGLLTLHLDKQHEGTRWSHVFASVGTKASSEIRRRSGGGDEDEDVEVPETLDPSELANIRESLEKYTSALVTGEDASGLGLGTGVPSLAENELDESVDAPGAVGRKFYVTWVSEGGSGETRPGLGSGSGSGWESRTGEGVPSYLLSVPVPGLERDSDSDSDEERNKKFSVVVRGDIDGLLFASPSSSSSPSSSLLGAERVENRTPTTNAWTHISTFPALAFVLASKRDTRFTFHASSSAVLSFESGAGLGGGNVFIYRGSGSKSESAKKETWAKQSVLKISGGSAGPLVGVGALMAPGEEGRGKGRVVLLCLCENELVVVRDVV